MRLGSKPLISRMRYQITFTSDLNMIPMTALTQCFVFPMSFAKNGSRDHSRALAVKPIHAADNESRSGRPCCSQEADPNVCKQPVILKPLASLPPLSWWQVR